MVYNSIIMETIGNSVMFLLGFYVFFSRVDASAILELNNLGIAYTE